MNTFDLVILGIVIVGVIFGLFKGLIKEVLSLLSLVLALIFSEMFSAKLNPYIAQIINAPTQIITIISYVIIFISTFILMLFIAKMLEKLLSKLHLSWFNTLLGGVFGGFKWTIIVSILLTVFNTLDLMFNFTNQQSKKDSILYYPTLHISPTLWEYSKSEYNTYKKDHLSDETK